MDIKEIRKLKDEDLEKELGQLRSQLEQVKQDIEVGKEKNVRKTLRIKKNIARILTVLNERKVENESKEK